MNLSIRQICSVCGGLLLLVPLLLFFVRLVNVAVTAHLLCVYRSVSVWTSCSLASFMHTTVGVIALIAHTLGVVLGVLVRAKRGLLFTFLLDCGLPESSYVLLDRYAWLGLIQELQSLTHSSSRLFLWGFRPIERDNGLSENVDIIHGFFVLVRDEESILDHELRWLASLAEQSCAWLLLTSLDGIFGQTLLHQLLWHWFLFAN